MLPAQKKLYYKELDQVNIEVTKVVSWLLLFFGILLLGLDVYRFQEADLIQRFTNRGLLFSHILFILIGLGSLLFYRFWLPEIAPDDYVKQYIFIYSFILLFGLAVIPITWFDLLTRASVIPFALYMVLVNLFFQLPSKYRFVINILSYLVLIFGVYFFIEGRYEQTVVFLEALGVVFVTLIIANSQYKLRKEKFYTQLKLIDTNKAIAQDNTALMMKALQSQMNPHFIFNTLNSIQHFLVFNDQASSIKYLNRFARLIRQIFQFSKKDLISINTEIEFLKLYLELEILRFEPKVKVDFEIDPVFLHVGNELVLPPLVLQPMVENAFKHGLMHLEKPGEVYLKFSKTADDILICRIIDNGVGRDFASGEGENESGSISIIEDRLAVYQALIKDGRKTFFEISDIKNKSDEIEGTEVQVHLPLMNAKSAKTNFRL